MRNIKVVSLFPELIKPWFEAGVLGRGIGKNLLNIEIINPRSFATDKHKTVDDRPFGGGDGMVLKPEIMQAAHDSIKSIQSIASSRRYFYLSPQGKKWNNLMAKKWAEENSDLVFYCGRYAGIDQRFLDENPEIEEVSIGDFVLSGGELAALSIIDSMARWIPGVLGNTESASLDSFGEKQLLEAPVYTRPAEWRGRSVPEVLTKGNHAEIEKWRALESLKVTRQKRPDLASAVSGKLAIGLLHHPVVDRSGKIVATNVTNFDIHDIARAARTYGASPYFIVHPVPEQLMFVSRILDHWRVGEGLAYNSSRRRALLPIELASNMEEVKKKWNQPKGRVFVTHARPVPGVKSYSVEQLKLELRQADSDPVMLLFGTGYGLTDEFMSGCDGVLESLKGPPPDDYRHLSVRSAASIYLDRLMGSH